MTKMSRSCKKANMSHAMVIGMHVVKEIEKKSFKHTSFTAKLGDLGEFHFFIAKVEGHQ